MIITTIDAGQAYEALELATELYEGDSQLHLGDGNTFADHMGCGVVVIDQVDLETREGQSVVLTQANLETLLSCDGLRVDLGALRTVGNYMGCGIYVIDQSPEDTPVSQSVVLTAADLGLLLAWLG